VLLVDTNVLIYAVDGDSEAHDPCRTLLEEWRSHPSPWFLTWPICYEFIRFTTHPRMHRLPWSAGEAWGFLSALLASPGCSILLPTLRHPSLLARTLVELPDLRGSIAHDLHTAVLMREHGVSRIYTRDTDFHRFPFLTVLDPLR
jgi:toxin-antitoxin system PIN domain toxin